MLYDLILRDDPPFTEIWGTLKQDVRVLERISTLSDDFGPGVFREQYTKIIPKGTRVRIWMASRFGDVGICDPADKNPCGYVARIGDEHAHWAFTAKQPDPKPDPIENWLEEVQKKVGNEWFPVLTAVAGQNPRRK